MLKGLFTMAGVEWDSEVKACPNSQIREVLIFLDLTHSSRYCILLFVLCQDVSSCRQEILSVCDEDGDTVVTKREFIRHAMKSVFIRSIL